MLATILLITTMVGNTVVVEAQEFPTEKQCRAVWTEVYNKHNPGIIDITCISKSDKEEISPNPIGTEYKMENKMDLGN